MHHNTYKRFAIMTKQELINLEFGGPKWGIVVASIADITDRSAITLIQNGILSGPSIRSKDYWSPRLIRRARQDPSGTEASSGSVNCY